MTTVQHELTTITNRLNRLDKSLETLEEEFGELDFFARHNIYTLHHYTTQKYSFIHSRHQQPESDNKMTTPSSP